MRLFLRKLLIVILLGIFSLGAVVPVYSQGLASLPSWQKGAIIPDYKPFLLKGLRYFPEDPYRFDFIVEPGDTLLSEDDLRNESSRLIKQFLTSLTIPVEDVWVNLSPLATEEVIPNQFGLTEMGRDLLLQDYELKQLSAMLMNPDQVIGKEFWSRVYARIHETLGNTDIPVDLFHKIWIVPEFADVQVRNNTVVVTKSRMKVMLAQDYKAQRFADQAHSFVTPEDKIVTQVMHSIILPEVEREINEGYRFARLRQIYNSYVLAVWMKRKIKSALTLQYVDQQKVVGIENGEHDAAQSVWRRYVKALQAGAFSLIREEQDIVSGDLIPRRYFSGGVDWTKMDESQNEIMGISFSAVSDKAMRVAVRMDPQGEPRVSSSPVPLLAHNQAVVSLEDRINLEAHFSLEDGQVALALQGKNWTFDRKGAFYYSFLSEDTECRISTLDRTEKNKGGYDKLIQRQVAALELAAQAGLGPRLLDYGLTADEDYYFLLERKTSIAVDTLDVMPGGYASFVDKKLIKEFLVKIHNEGILFESVEPKSLIVVVNADGKKELWFRDSQLVWPSLENPSSVNDEIKRKLRFAVKKWPQEIHQFFEESFAEIASEFGNKEKTGNDYWHRSSDEEDSESALLAISVNMLESQRNAGLIFSESVLGKPKLFLNGHEGVLVGQGESAYIFSVDSKIYRIGKRVRSDQYIMRDYSFIEKVRSFLVAALVDAGPRVFGFGLTADGSHFYLAVEYWEGTSLDQLTQDKIIYLVGEGHEIIEDFFQKMYKNGVFLPDFSIGNIFLKVNEDDSQELKFVDAESVTYSYTDPLALSLQVQEAIDNDWLKRAPLLWRAFRMINARFIKKFEGINYSKDHWGHAKNKGVDRAQKAEPASKADMPGGIDLNDQAMLINEFGDSDIMQPLPTMSEPLFDGVLLGFKPVILGVNPLGDIYAFADHP